MQTTSLTSPAESDFRHDIQLDGANEFVQVKRIVEVLITAAPPVGYRLMHQLDADARRLKDAWEDDLSYLSQALGVSLDQISEQMDANEDDDEYWDMLDTQHGTPTASVMRKVAAAVGVDLDALADEEDLPGGPAG